MFFDNVNILKNDLLELKKEDTNSEVILTLQKSLQKLEDFFDNFNIELFKNEDITDFPLFVDIDFFHKLMLHPLWVQYDQNSNFGKINRFYHGCLFGITFYSGKNTKGIGFYLN